MYEKTIIPAATGVLFAAAMPGKERGEFIVMSMPVITPGTGTRCQAITDIIASVALEQTALSHILNAEGEKIQKIVAGAATADELLAVNKSVNSMVDSITRLEMLLQSKLQLFADCLCGECPTTA